MLDALVPGGWRPAGPRSTAAPTCAAVTAAMADAAEAGAPATIPMLATKGRASYLGERSDRPPGSRARRRPRCCCARSPTSSPAR